MSCVPGIVTCASSLITHQITYLEEYYLTNDEITVLKESASSIAEWIPEDAMVIELGSGYVLTFLADIQPTLSHAGSVEICAK